jgi:hypothetical protein
MKRIIPIALIAACISTIACKKSSSTQPYAMTAQTSQGPITTSSVSVVASFSKDTVGIEGDFPPSQPPYIASKIYFQISHFTGVGTYILSQGDPYVAYTTDISNTPASFGYVGLYGVLTITATSPNMVGTFSFTCTDSTKVSNGSFNIKGL